MWDLLLRRTGSSFVAVCGLLTSCGVWVFSSLVVACRFSLLQLWHAGFLFSSCGARAPGRMGSVVVAGGSLVEVPGLSSCGAWA